MGRNVIGVWGRIIDVYVRDYKYLLILLGDDFKTAKWVLLAFLDKRIRMNLNKENIEIIIENYIEKVTV